MGSLPELARAADLDATPDDNGRRDVAAESTYGRGKRMLAELLALEGFIPEPTADSLRRYFPVLAGELPLGLPDGEWGHRLEGYCDLITQYGRSGVVPRSLVTAMLMWESRECVRARKIPAPPARWYQEAIAEWKRIRDASREAQVRSVRHVRRQTPAVRTTPASPARDQAAGEALAHSVIPRLWSPPDPALTNHGLAVESEYLQERLRDPVYQQRYLERIGEPEPISMPAHV